MQKDLIYNDDIFGSKIIGITNGQYWIKECNSSEADKLVIAHHYSHKTTKNRFKS